ncbi:MAG: GGDEF domain-containing protein [Clostridia bacterium]|nr:GGDEF domain-containing protein [Clostridia bacterium]
MLYATFGILALVILVIINVNVLLSGKRRNERPASSTYRFFLRSVIFFYLTDILWGLLYEYHLRTALIVDTYVYFVAMAASVLLWTRFVIAFLGEKGPFAIILTLIGWLFFAFEAIILIMNINDTVMFYIGKNGEYYVYYARNISLAIQIAMFFASSVYALVVSARRSEFKRRYVAIGVSGLAMMSVILVQTANPLFPLYSIGLTIATCILHTFVVADVREERRRELERANEAMEEARRCANTDSLTGVKSKHAYIEAEIKIDERINDGTLGDFGIVVFDVNGLKKVNDTFGHVQGDNLLKKACERICARFSHSPVFRIGGDEFVAMLEGEDYARREELLKGFDEASEGGDGFDVVLAAGMAEYKKSVDKSYSAIFVRADNKMYERKEYLKRISD